MIIQCLHDVFDRADYKFVLALPVGVNNEVEFAPFLLDFLKLILDFFLASGTGRYFLHCLYLLDNSILQELIQLDLLVGLEGLL